MCVRRLLPLVLVAFGCARVQAPTRPAENTSGPVRDYASLVEHLQDAGLRVEAAGEVQQPFFTPRARVIRVGDTGEAQVYEYASEQQAAAEASRVNPDGSIGTSMPMWIAPPHFFRKRSLIVLYLGSDDRTLVPLRGLLGQQFAGSP